MSRYFVSLAITVQVVRCTAYLSESQGLKICEEKTLAPNLLQLQRTAYPQQLRSPESTTISKSRPQDHEKESRVAVATFFDSPENSEGVNLSETEVALLIYSIRSARSPFLRRSPIFVHTTTNIVDDTDYEDVQVVKHSENKDLGDLVNVSWHTKLLPLYFEYPVAAEAVIYFDSDVVVVNDIEPLFGAMIFSKLQCVQPDVLYEHLATEVFYKKTFASVSSKPQVCNAGVYSIPTKLMSEFSHVWANYMHIAPTVAGDQGAFTAAAHSLGILAELPSNANFCTSCAQETSWRPGSELHAPRGSWLRAVRRLSPGDPIAIVHHHACREHRVDHHACKNALQINLETAASMMPSEYKDQAQILSNAAQWFSDGNVTGTNQDSLMNPYLWLYDKIVQFAQWFSKHL